jgi:large subunit ribosomal protein L21
MIAVIKTGGKQYTVTEGQTLKVEKLSQESRKNDKISFTDILLVSDGKAKHSIGRPIVADAKVEGTIVSDGRAKKIRVIKYKPKVRYKRTVGHRQPFTEVKIDKISV